MLDKIRFTVKCLSENRLRLFLTILSITAAVGSVLLIRALSGFGVAAVWSELDSLGMNGLIVSAEDRGITEQDLSVIGSTNGVTRCAPVTVTASKVFKGIDETNAVIWGIDERACDVVSFDLLYGRLIDKSDLRAARRVCVVDQALALSIYGSENIVGKTVDLMCAGAVQSFSVVGVVKTGKGIMQSMMGSYFPAFLYTPYTAACSGDFSQVFVKTDGVTPSDIISRDLTKALDGHASVTDLAGQKGTLESMLNIVTNVLTVIGAISVFVSGISIMNIMLISVNERTKEIGIKKSIGASGGDIMLDFLLESVIIAFAGTVSGIVAASVISFAASVMIGTAVTLTLRSVIAAVVIAGLCGIAFGIFPAYKAACYRPVTALRR